MAKRRQNREIRNLVKITVGKKAADKTKRRNQLKEETEEDAPIDTAFTEELHDDLVCIKFKLEKVGNEDKKVKKKSGRKLKENVSLKTLRERERKKLTCDSCDNFVTKSSKKMERHLFEVHEQTMCHICGMNFTSFEKLFDHSSSHKESIVCNKCGEEFKEQRTYRNHMSRIHPENSGIVCQQCGKTYSSPESLSAHIKYTHEKNFVPFLCPHEDCSTTFKDECNLRRHLSSVHQRSMEKCQWCGKFVKTMHSLKRHLKLYQCNIPEEERVKRTIEKKECEICKKLVSNLARHMNTMHGHGKPKEFQCGHCNYKTNKKYNLKLHVTRVHEGDYHKKTCPHCLKEFIDLEFHIKSYHYDAILFENSEGTSD